MTKAKAAAKAGAKARRGTKAADGRKAVVSKKQPTADQARAIQQARHRWDELPERAELRAAIDGNTRTIDSPHSDQGGFTASLGAAFGSRSHPFVTAAIGNVFKVAGDRGKGATEDQANSALAFVAAVAPADEVEAAMAVQMFATNELAMEMLTRARHSDDRQATMEYGNLATKLSRTFTAQVEALSKLRRGGEQVVKYVHVHEGGQAVVAGSIHHQGGRVNGKGSVQPHGQATDAPVAALPGADPARDGVPLAGDAEREMPPARREESGGA